MTLEEIMMDIKDGGVQGDFFYSYPTGPAYGATIAEEDEDTECELVYIIDTVIKQACEHIGVNPLARNKTAVRVWIYGHDDPIFFVSYDNKRIICTDIARKDGSHEIELK